MISIFILKELCKRKIGWRVMIRYYRLKIMRDEYHWCIKSYPERFYKLLRVPKEMAPPEVQTWILITSLINAENQPCKNQKSKKIKWLVLYPIMKRFSLRWLLHKNLSVSGKILICDFAAYKISTNYFEIFPGQLR